MLEMSYRLNIYSYCFILPIATKRYCIPRYWFYIYFVWLAAIIQFDDLLFFIISNVLSTYNLKFIKISKNYNEINSHWHFIL